MIASISGSLLSHEALDGFIRDQLRAVLDEAGSHRVRTHLRAWHLQIRRQLGPTAGPRTVFDRVAAPLFAQLGYRVLPANGTSDLFRATLEARGKRAAALLVTGWGRDPANAWRDAVRQGIGLDVRWCFCATGPLVRVVDTRRTYSRRFVEFALENTIEDQRAFAVFWGLLRADAMVPTADGVEAALDRAILLSEEHRAEIRDSLQEGVQDAVLHLNEAFSEAERRSRRRIPHANANSEQPRTFDEALIVIYRILFLLFAEARGLVPRWHPIFRDAYTIEALRESVELLPRPRGLWESLQAMARLAHRGCHIGALHVPPFNGRLFSPGHAPLSDSLPLDDEVVRRAVLALTTRPVRRGRVRVAYGDLGVEQLGGIYERLLDFEPAPSSTHRKPRLVPAEARKSSGSFYTPRSLTEFLVRRTLAPLIRDASPEQILALRIVDPAMGSGAFLVAACRYLASAYEAALIREGAFISADVAETERVWFRRVIAQQCLFGVDLNPMAVQLARLSLWLATLSADRPLTFFDHRLRVGNSLVGARLEDLLRQPPPIRRTRAARALPLFDQGQIGAAIQHAVGVRVAIAAQPDDTLEQVRGKERAIAELAEAAALARWKAVADLWCAGWFRESTGQRQSANAFGALADALLQRGDTLPAHTAAPLLAEARAIAAEQRFFHWTLEFPEIFHGTDGLPRPKAGFDAVIGNPPWEMLRGDRGTAEGRRLAHVAGSRLTSFTRSSGVYMLQGTGHANLYQLFLERSLSLLRAEGRLGMILPSGFAIDHGSSELRTALFDHTVLDGVISVENRDGVFPIHRSLKFLLVTATTAGRSASVTCRFGVRNPIVLDGFPDTGFDRDAVTLTRPLLERIGGAGMALPELRTTKDVEIVSAITFRCPALGDPDGWNARFGRELNATDDRAHFVSASESRAGLPVVEGKHLSPFSVELSATDHRIRVAVASRLLDGRLTFERARLAYRDVAASTNRLTLIAAIVPAGSVTTHTLFCLKDLLDEEVQHYLCGIFNSFVANYLVRPRISTHIGASIIARLPVPKPSRQSGAFREVASLSASLSKNHNELAAAKLQALAAQLYGLREEQFRHVLETFPLVPAGLRTAAIEAFCDIVT